MYALCFVMIGKQTRSGYPYWWSFECDPNGRLKVEIMSQEARYNYARCVAEIGETYHPPIIWDLNNKELWHPRHTRYL